MNAQEILKLAQQGHPRAIATLLNFITQSQGMKARVQRQADHLHVLFEAEPVPQEQEAVLFVRQSLEALNVQGIEQLTVYGRSPGKFAPTWKHTVIYLDSEAEPSPLDYEDQPSVPSSSAIAYPAEVVSEFDRVEFPTAEPLADTLFAPFEETEPAPLPLDSEMPNVMKRPEAVIFIIFVSIVIFWDTYIELLEGDTSAGTVLSTSQLARRLQISSSTLRRHRRLDDFQQWTQQLDPDGIRWVYRHGLYFPQMH